MELIVEFVTFFRVFAKAEFTHPIQQKIRRTNKYCCIPQNRVFAKAEFTHPIQQKIRRTNKYCGIPQNRVFAKAEFTNQNFTKKVRILFVESKVEMDLRKRNRFSTKYLTGRKKRGWDNLWSRSTKFENIVEFVLWNPTICLGPNVIFCGI